MAQAKDNIEKREVLLHYDSELRNDWRELHRMRLVVVGVLGGAGTSVIGWFASKPAPLDAADRTKLLLVLIALGPIIVFSMAWFGSSINTIKRILVHIEEALGLFEAGHFRAKGAIFDEACLTWGGRGRWRWGKATLAAVALWLLMLAVVVVLFKLWP